VLGFCLTIRSRSSPSTGASAGIGSLPADVGFTVGSTSATDVSSLSFGSTHTGVESAIRFTSAVVGSMSASDGSAIWVSRDTRGCHTASHDYSQARKATSVLQFRTG
jgi:hypothetical protein